MKITIKFPKIKKSFKKSDQGIRPSLFWNIILYTAFAVILASFAFGFYLFQTVNKGTVLSIEEMESKTNLIKEERVDRVLEYLKTRAEKSSEIINTPAPIVDPSL
ncbi:hypothetical protein A2914_00530 [Candidatus Nomurabacteria bacterium RIFCSPLOWO2_01_FULL_41_21]|uniref:Uncharacterized protein n=2 Tax=Candidatus Nomuraibacteriota TaxID=1752729 RepID=A0A1F6V3I2_9BACT|nr:MAG: hypothetical protein A2733_02890 [Candidatus Nomurabacteria bacterium RIFCSPHIGHO2_01_FULL_40_20]OGI88328.1 MAG: hypothetical protein A2914_00530 [Candidatus Nomurabacteria bacterium RIFCSPLOWO2_01_FULL_41_21]